MKKSLINLCLALVMCSACSNEIEQPLEPQAPKLNVKDSLAIVDIWEKSDGENWVIKWDLKDFHTWGGAGLYLDSITNEYRVVKLQINIPVSDNVRGEISPRLGDLTELRCFRVSGLGITGKIPESINKLKQIEIFEIQHTDVTGTLPTCLFSMPNIRELNISSNSGITGNLPKEILNLPFDMVYVAFIQNNLSGKIPSGIKLNRALKLNRNRFTEFPFEYCQEGKTIIDLSGNEISGLIPDSILNNEYALSRLRALTWKQKEGFSFQNTPDNWESGDW